MESLKFWSRPAIATALWIAAAAMTLSELATVPPSLRSASSSAPRYEDVRQRAPSARVLHGARAALAR